jgi:hypothetical protein
MKRLVLLSLLVLGLGAALSVTFVPTHQAVAGKPSAPK